MQTLQAARPAQETIIDPKPQVPFQRIERATLYNGDALDLYDLWGTPTVIFSDGAYGISGFPGDPPTPLGLVDWYKPHIERWSRLSTPQTTLWFWNTEIGWATVHPLLVEMGWEYRGCNIWDKGLGHIAGNSNTKTLRKFPPVTEVCAHYVKSAQFRSEDQIISMQDWLRKEWIRTGLPMSRTNEACGVKNAATRKYFTACHLWYYPPVEMFERFAEYANLHGDELGRPYFSIDGIRPIGGEEWGRMRSKFNLNVGISNVWNLPAVRGDERIKMDGKAVHLNQKPELLTERVIAASSDINDIIWEPFGGLATAALVSNKLQRVCYSSEISQSVYQEATKRLQNMQTRLI